MTKLKDIKTAIEIFKEAAAKQAAATEQGDYKMGNKYYNKIERAVAFLKNGNAMDNLLSLLDNPSVGVRMWAASYLLSTYEVEGTKVLEQIKAGPGIHSLTAETTLSEWQKGNLKF